MFLLSVMLFVLSVSLVFAVVPSGVTPVEVSDTAAPSDAAGTNPALAGNVTELTIFGYTNTQSWQGYYGNVSGTIQLADSSDNVMYNWSLADPEGEVYATVNTTVNWAGTACFNVTNNHLGLEGQYGIASDDVDGINETFNEYVHSEFYVNNIQILANSCNSIEVFSDDQASTAGQFEEVILEGGSGEIIFTALLEETSVLGFDTNDHDFEMLVLEDGHGTDTATTTYYFYVELQ